VLFSCLMTYNSRMAVAVSGAARMAEVRAMLDMLDPADTEAQLIDRIRRVKDVMAAMTAVQAEDAAELEALRHENEKARGVPKARRGNGLAAEIGLARGQSPARWTKDVTMARTLEGDMHHNTNAMTVGQINKE